MHHLDHGKYLKAPSRPKSSSYRSDASTAYTSTAVSARSSAMSEYPAEAQCELEGTIKVADLINMRAVLPKSTIRRDMFGNLRPVPRAARIAVEGENEGFAETQQKPKRSIDPLLNPALYVERITRIAKSCDTRKVNLLRQKFSGQQRQLGYWNPYLKMSDSSKYAQLANPYL